MNEDSINPGHPDYNPIIDPFSETKRLASTLSDFRAALLGDGFDKEESFKLTEMMMGTLCMASMGLDE